MALVSDPVSTASCSSTHTPLLRLYDIRRAAVLGAGTMGSRIAAHIANAGLPVLLLDMVPANLDAAKGDRSTLARKAIEALGRIEAGGFCRPRICEPHTLGNFDDDLEKLKDCDWVIEAVAENLEIKQALLKKAAAHLHARAIFTTNTSGLPVAKIGASCRKIFGGDGLGRTSSIRRGTCGWWRLIATPESDAEAIAAVVEFCDRRLGKTAVPANDVANFIANRIGTFQMLNTFADHAAAGIEY